MTAKAVIITGVSGFMGEHALRLALQTYDFVIASDIRPISYSISEFDSRKRFVFVVCDITQKDDLEKLRRTAELFLESAPEARLDIHHMAGLFNYAAKETALVEINKRGTENVVGLLAIPLQKHLRSFIYWSGLTVFGKFDFPLPTTEESPRRPDNPYGWSKLHAEEFLLRAYQEKNLPVTIMELSSVYGPGGPIRERYGMALLIKLLYEGRMPNIPIGKAGKRAALIHAEDVIRVAHFLSGVEEARGERYIVTDDTPYTTEELSQFLGELLENPFISFIRLPEKVFDLLVQSSEEARKYGAKPEIDAGLAQMIKLNPHASNAKLMDLARRHGRGRNSPNPLLKYPNSFDGLRQTVAAFKKEGWLR